MKSIVASFKRYHDADRAIEQLDKHGFDENKISAVMRAHVMDAYLNRYNRLGWKTVTGAISGATLGGLTGLLVGLGTIAVPGLGSLLATGSLASALSSATVGGGLGAAAGGLVGALAAMGVPGKEAEMYREDVKRGSVVVAVHSDERVDEACDVLVQSGATTVNTYLIDNSTSTEQNIRLATDSGQTQ